MTLAKHVLTISLLLVMSVGPAVAQSQPTGRVPGRFIVKLAPRVSLGSLSQTLQTGQQLKAPSQLIVKASLVGFDNWQRVLSFSTEDTTLTAAQLKEQLGARNVEYVEPEYYLDFYDYPSDELFSHQWYLSNTGQDFWAILGVDGPNNDQLILQQGTSGNDVGVSYYYENPSPASTRVVVAIVDTGIDSTHPDLQGQIWHNPGEVPGNGIDDDHNGFIDDIIGYDISGDTLALLDFDGDNDPTDIIGHGTHIAGIVAAIEDGQGITGVAPSAQIMAVKIRPNGTSRVGALGIIYAVNSGANVINVSWGTPFKSLVLQDAINFARDNGVLVCVSSGNSGDLRLHYPAAFDESFTVGAGNAWGHVTAFSTFGNHIDLIAPGENILSLRAAETDMYIAADEPNVHIVGPDANYYLANGTSMSAPMVAGAAARIWSLRPELTLEQLVAHLHNGARDMLDPFGIGDTLPGFDSISGFGYLDIRRSVELATTPGLFFVSPTPHSRHIGSVSIVAAPIGGYLGSWELSYALSKSLNNWQPLASGSSLPPDSILYTLSGNAWNDRLILRLTDDHQTSQYLRLTLVTGNHLEISSPVQGAEYNYNIPIIGTVYGTDYVSTQVYYRPAGGSRELLFETSGEYFDSLIFSWNASGASLGRYTLYLEATFESGILVDTVSFDLLSAFAEGWPQDISGRSGLSAIAADLNGDSFKEIIVGTTFGLNVFDWRGRPLSGFPALTGTLLRGIPAAYDIDHDGFKEIICTTDSAVYAINYDGSIVDGWPVTADLAWLSYGTPTPVIAELGSTEDSAIVVMAEGGNVMAYDFDGQSYFYSLEGWFTSFNETPTGSRYLNGNGLAASDLDGDGTNELVVSYSSVVPYIGVAVFEGRTGQPGLGRYLPYVLEATALFGTILTDLNGDNLDEIITVGADQNRAITIWAKTGGYNDLDGWPVTLPDIKDWIGVYPVAADLDLDGVPEILVSFYEFDIGSLYVFRADGTPFITREGRPYGEAYQYAATFGVPVVANMVGDAYPEIILRSGYLFPGTGREKVHILDHNFEPVPGWPISTPTPPSQVFSTPYAPLVDDIDGDGLVEMVLVGEGLSIFVWDFEASSEEGRNHGRIFADNLNSSVYTIERTVTDVDEPAPVSLPAKIALEQNYPNPFNPTTAISFVTGSRQLVQLDIFNVLGQTVINLVDQELPAGHHTLEFDGSELASGVYFYRLRAGDYESTRKMVLLK